ncbi:fused PTS fructose transporter subunit IIA/HPr protein [Pseudaeromonas sharmana]|uniref:Multiphosphoryl transfer protein n=1 Tax=Pseudaeromonas sharmana TaxID=328412 RepID=A0ABV8CLL8_9GAMM
MLTLQQQDVRLGAKATDKQDAIRQVAASLTEAGLVAAGYVDGMLRREAQTATYLGSGIAIPHGTTDTRDQVRQTGVKVLHFADGVEWAEGQKAYVVIGIAAKSDEHLGILRQLTRVLSDDSVAEQLRAASSVETLTALLNGEQQSQPLLLDASTLLDAFPARDLLTLQAAAAGLLANAGAIGAAAVHSVVTTDPLYAGQGLWLARVAEDVSRTAVALVRCAAPFDIAGQAVQGMVLIAACDSQHQPVLSALIEALAGQRIEALWRAELAAIPALLGAAPQIVAPAGHEATFTIINPHGLHARPSAMLVKTVKEFESQIWVANLDGDAKPVNAKSLMKLVSLGVRQGHRLHFTADGSDAPLALEKIGQAIADGLGEGAGE